MSTPGSNAPDYTAWSSIDYRPAIADFLPDRLLPFLPPASATLDVGCNTGHIASFLGRHGHSCRGIDLNPAAIASAIDHLPCSDVSRLVTFVVADFQDFEPSQLFDAILMIRVLTCVPEVSPWRSMLRKAHSSLKPEGLIYVHDFVSDPSSPVYGPRYAEGRARGWREGNFPVLDAAGALSFVAHHHSSGDLAEIAAPYETLLSEQHDSLSMNGNPCRMIEFIGRKSSGSTVPFLYDHTHP